MDFDRSLATGDAPTYNDCMPGTSLTLAHPANSTRDPTATVQKRGASWIVTVRYPHSGGGARYQVHHRAGGYCVFRQLDAF
jgi:hypothetical protein